MRVLFISTLAFDANISLIKALNKKCDIYFITEALHEVYNHINKDALSKLITIGTDVPQIQRFSELIPLEKTYVVKGCRQINIFKKIWNSYKIHKLVKKINPDVVISDNFLLTYMFTQIYYRKQTLLIVHDPFLHSGEKRFIDSKLRQLYFSLIPNKILLNLSQRKDFIEFYKQDEGKIYTSFLSVYEYLTCFDSEVRKDNDFNVLFFGRISPYKGINYLLEAFMDILNKETYNNITLTIAGSGNFDFDISKYEKFKQIRIINKFIQPDELAKLISLSSVVVCPYIDATQSGVVMSAFAFKKPVIATSVGGLPEMISNMKTGILIPPRNKKEIENAIIKLYNTPALLEQMEDSILEEYFEGERSWVRASDYFFEAIINMSR